MHGPCVALVSGKQKGCFQLVVKYNQNPLCQKQDSGLDIGARTRTGQFLGVARLKFGKREKTSVA